MSYETEGYANLYTYISELGQSEESIAKSLNLMSDSQITDLFWKLYFSVKPMGDNNPSLFTFSATNALTGGKFPCEELGCRLRRANEFSLYSALYADKVLVPFPLNDMLYSAEAKKPLNRIDLLEALLIIRQYDPVAR
jgi:hypothetical protein